MSSIERIIQAQLTITSLYVRGLVDKLPKEDLKRNLYMLFATYGVILDIIALKTMKMRGQAHIVFRDIDSATQAMRALQGFTFFGKDIVRTPLCYPHSSSHDIPAYCLREDKVQHNFQTRRNIQTARA